MSPPKIELGRGSSIAIYPPDNSPGAFASLELLQCAASGRRYVAWSCDCFLAQRELARLTQFRDRRPSPSAAGGVFAVSPESANSVLAAAPATSLCKSCIACPKSSLEGLG